jgi:hypothetical protein
VQDVRLSNHQFYDHASYLFFSESEEDEDGWGGVGVGESKDKEEAECLYSSIFLPEETAALKSGFDVTTV